MNANRDATPTPPDREWMTCDEAAMYLGVITTTLWRWRKRAIIRGARVGGVVRYSRASIDAALSKRERGGR